MIFTSLVVSGLTISKTCWELEDMNIRSNKFPEERHPSWFSNLLIGCLWRFFAVTSQVFSIVVFLIFLWVHFLFKTQFGSFKFDTSTIENIFFVPNASIDYNEVLKGDEDSLVKYYVYLIPVGIFLLPFVVNVWARRKYIGLNDEYSIAYGILSAVVPVW